MENIVDIYSFLLERISELTDALEIVKKRKNMKLKGTVYVTELMNRLI